MVEDKASVSTASTKTTGSILKDDTNSSGDTKSNNKSWGKKFNGNLSTKPKKFQGVAKGLEDHYLYYGRGMNTKWLDSREQLLSYVGRKYTANEVTPLEGGSLAFDMVTKPKNVGAEAEFEKLDYFEQESWKLELKSYNDVKMKT